MKQLWTLTHFSPERWTRFGQTKIAWRAMHRSCIVLILSLQWSNVKRSELLKWEQKGATPFHCWRQNGLKDRRIMTMRFHLLEMPWKGVVWSEFNRVALQWRLLYHSHVEYLPSYILSSRVYSTRSVHRRPPCCSTLLLRSSECLDGSFHELIHQRIQHVCQTLISYNTDWHSPYINYKVNQWTSSTVDEAFRRLHSSEAILKCKRVREQRQKPWPFGSKSHCQRRASDIFACECRPLEYARCSVHPEQRYVNSTNRTSQTEGSSLMVPSNISFWYRSSSVEALNNVEL